MRKNKKILTIGISCLMVILLVVGLVVGGTGAKADDSFVPKELMERDRDSMDDKQRDSFISKLATVNKNHFEKIGRTDVLGQYSEDTWWYAYSELMSYWLIAERVDESYWRYSLIVDDDNLRAKYVELALQAIESTRDTDDIFTMHEADELLLFIDRNKKFQTKTMQDRFDEIGSYYLKIYSRGTKNLKKKKKRRFPDLYPDTYEEYYQQYLDGLWRD